MKTYGWKVVFVDEKEKALQEAANYPDFVSNSQEYCATLANAIALGLNALTTPDGGQYTLIASEIVNGNLSTPFISLTEWDRQDLLVKITQALRLGHHQGMFKVDGDKVEIFLPN